MKTMSNPKWKQLERDCAAAFGATRHWANAGERVDFTGPHVIGQCKLVKTCSLEQLTRLAEEMQVMGTLDNKLGVVCTKVRRGRGKDSPILVTMTLPQFTEWLDFRTRNA